MEKTVAVRLQSSSLVHTPGMIKWYKHIYSYDRQTGFLQMSHGFPTLPGLMVLDILSGRCEGKVEPGPEPNQPSISFEWTKPMADYKEYLFQPEEKYEETNQEIEEAAA